LSTKPNGRAVVKAKDSMVMTMPLPNPPPPPAPQDKKRLVCWGAVAWDSGAGPDPAWDTGWVDFDNTFGSFTETPTLVLSPLPSPDNTGIPYCIYNTQLENTRFRAVLISGGWPDVKPNPVDHMILTYWAAGRFD
jgi:hypothetical protein